MSTGNPTEINGTNGNDNLNGTSGDDRIDGGNGNDTIKGNAGHDIIYGGAGNDTINGGSGDDTIYGGAGNDTIGGDTGDDVIYGGAGSDSLYGGTGSDALFLGYGQNVSAAYGDIGDDVLVGGGGQNENFYGGSGNDLIIVKAPPAPGTTQSWYTDTNFHVYGGDGGTDRLSYQDLLDNGFVLASTPVRNGSYPDYSGQMRFVNHTTKQYINLNCQGIAEFVTMTDYAPCFTDGTLVVTPLGERPVEDLRSGDLVVTRDNGLQEICWVGARRLTAEDLAARPALRPILIRQGALGRGLPMQDLLVSPNHRVLIRQDRAGLMFDDQEVLVAAKYLVDGETIVVSDQAQVRYIHFMCRQHEIVLSNGCWTESFQPGDMALKSLTAEQRREVFALFPELRRPEGIAAYPPARRVLRRHEATLLTTPSVRQSATAR